MTRLQVLISTFGADGLKRTAAMTLPEIEGVGYLISCQSSETSIPAELQRQDVEVHFTDSIGLSRNRNNALKHATAEYALLADDDLTFDPDGLKEIIKTFDTHKHIDIATFMSEMAYKKAYPPEPHDLSIPYKNYNISSIEIAFRLSSFKKAKLSFHPDFGVGSGKFGAGEENLILLQAMERGLNGYFFPILVAKHPHETTGTRDVATPAVLKAQGILTALTYKTSFAPRLMLKAKRTRGNVFKNLYHLSQGAIYGLLHKRALLDFGWSESELE